MCVTSLCASIQECFRQALFPLRCLCSYQSSQETQASETLFGLSEVVGTRAVFLLWHYHRACWARFAPRGNTTLSCAQWLADEQAMMWHYCYKQAKERCKSFCCWQDIVTFPLSIYFIHARLFSLSISLKHAHKYSACGPLLCVRISRSLYRTTGHWWLMLNSEASLCEKNMKSLSCKVGMRLSCFKKWPLKFSLFKLCLLFFFYLLNTAQFY